MITQCNGYRDYTQFLLYKNEPKMNNTESPCVRDCCLNEQGICTGCLRSLEQIKEWGQASESRKAAIIKQIEFKKSHSKS